MTLKSLHVAGEIWLATTLTGCVSVVTTQVVLLPIPMETTLLDPEKVKNQLF